MLHLGSGVTGVELTGDGKALIVKTPRGMHEVDFVIAGTGFGVDPHARPELSDIVDRIATWADRHPAAAARPDSASARSPYLGPAFELQPKDPREDAALARIHAFNGAAVQSHGKVTTGVPAASLAAQRLAQGIVAALFVAERETFHAAMLAHDRDEVPPGTWRDAAETHGETTGQMFKQTEA